VKLAKQARGVVVWGDETGLRADDVRGRSYWPSPAFTDTITRLMPPLGTLPASAPG
jgi:hypothetical protein